MSANERDRGASKTKVKAYSFLGLGSNVGSLPRHDERDGRVSSDDDADDTEVANAKVKEKVRSAEERDSKREMRSTTH
jgi:hypothetical protein